MLFFGKKKDEEEDDDEELVRKKPLYKKKFKDLIPDNKKKRKEPVKPWTRKERYLVLGILSATVLLSSLLALSARSWKLPGLPKLGLPSLGFFQDGTIVIQSSKEESASQKDIEKSEKVIADFKLATRDLSGVYGLYVVDLDTGYSYGVNERDTFQAASLIKLPVLAAFYGEVESGNIDLATEYTLKNSDKIGGSGSIAGKPAGTVYTLGELASLMGKQSDNTAFNVIRKLLGDSLINEVTLDIGMTKTSLEENSTSPHDIGLFFQKLWNKDLVGSENAERILDSLTDTVYEEWLAAGIPDSVRVAHKYGREVHVVNDAGIVFAERPYVVVIMTDGVVEREADTVFPELSKIVYDMEGK